MSPGFYTLNTTTSDTRLGLAGLPIAAGVKMAGALNSVAGFSSAQVPGFLPPAPGTLDVYRQISGHPTVALAMRIVTSPIVANTWGFAANKNVPAEWSALLRRAVSPLRHQAVQVAMHALEYGFAGFEKVWDVRDGRRIVVQLKPLLPEFTQILVDSHGEFQGLRNQVPGNAPIDLPPEKAFLYSYDGDCGNLYGRSRHENVRAIWSQALQTSERLAQYQKKVAGVTVQLHYPEGVSRDAGGVERSNDCVAQQILEAVSMGRSVRFPNLFASADDPRVAADLAGKSQWVLSQFDPGGADHATGLLNALAYYDKLLFRGWLRPERVGLEAQHGTRADAKQHSESSVLDSELIDRDFADAFNRQVVDDLLVNNFGEVARGAVRVQPSPISDEKTETARSVVSSLLRNAQTALRLADRIDVESLLEDLDLPTKPKMAQSKAQG